MSAKANGEARLDIKNLTTEQALEVLIEAIAQLSEQIQENHIELVEKIENIDVSGDGFGFEE